VIILDTNVISEMIRPEPSAVVLRNVGSFLSLDLYTTVIAEAEIRLGLAILPSGKKRLALESQVDLNFKEDFESRVLPFDSEGAQRVSANHEYVVRSNGKYGSAMQIN